ncbi:hypothetical protein ACWGIU_35440 [Streptomyces sp. NPDC054840]
MGSSRRILGALGLLSCLTFFVHARTAEAAAPAPKELPRIPFAQRYQAVQHGGLVRASNSGIGCREERSPQVEPCAEVKKGAAGVDSEFEMFHSEDDKDPDTYNSTRAELKVPQGAKVSHARLCWGGNCGWMSRSRRRTTAGCWSPIPAARTRRSLPARRWAPVRTRAAMPTRPPPT